MENIKSSKETTKSSNKSIGKTNNKKQIINAHGNNIKNKKTKENNHSYKKVVLTQVLQKMNK